MKHEVRVMQPQVIRGKQSSRPPRPMVMRARRMRPILRRRQARRGVITKSVATRNRQSGMRVNPSRLARTDKNRQADPLHRH